MAEGSAPAQLIEFVVKAIVEHSDDVKVIESDGGSLLELETHPDDRGRVIGRQGRVAKAMRALLGVSRHGSGCRLDIVD
ncbi:MAG: KH domain-containing protein [Myxococcota bacterium]